MKGKQRNTFVRPQRRKENTYLVGYDEPMHAHTERK